MFYVILLFLTGISVGSFINVVVDRLPHSRSIIFGRSKCDFCRKILKWYDLLPVVSFVLLRGRCRYCHRVLSLQYPLIEIFTAVVFMVTYLILQRQTPSMVDARYIYAVVIFSGLLAITVIDLKHMIIPDSIVVFLLLTVIIYRLIYNPTAILSGIIAGIMSLTAFLALVVITRGRGMGMGDVKLAFFMGLFLGWPGILISFYLAFLTGAFVSLILIIAGKKKMKSIIPFGPFLCFATGLSYLYGDEIWKVMTKLLGI